MTTKGSAPNWCRVYRWAVETVWVHASRCDHTRERQQQRDADGDERAEDGQEHDDRDRDGALAGRLQLVCEHLVECLAGADRAGLADVEPRVPVADLGDRGLDPSIFFFATSALPFMFQVTMTVRRLFET
jgi:hypothetical protein